MCRTDGAYGPTQGDEEQVLAGAKSLLISKRLRNVILSIYYNGQTAAQIQAEQSARERVVASRVSSYACCVRFQVLT